MHNFLYIDDTEDQIEQGTINGLQASGEIKITFQKPKSWEELINYIVENRQQFDGIILDLRLNQKPYEDNKVASYRGTTVAQELRTLSKERVVENDFPIILISGDAAIESSLDVTSLDLFDLLVNKTKLEKEDGFTYKELIKKLKWLAEGYDVLTKKEKKIETILGIDNISILETRFIDEFNRIVDKPSHIIARFLIKHLINKPSFLINENYLSARLGVNKDSKDWSNLLQQLTQFKYTGAFSSYYDRWWMYKIEGFWEEMEPDSILRHLPAEKRVMILTDKMNLKELAPLEKADKSKSECFWTCCKATNIAIDTIDGFVIAGQDDLFPWQEKEYVCFNEALRPTKIELWKSVAPLEKNRLQKLKKLYESIEAKRERT